MFIFYWILFKQNEKKDCKAHEIWKISEVLIKVNYKMKSNDLIKRIGFYYLPV